MSRRMSVLVVLLFLAALAFFVVKPAKAIRQVQTPDGQTFVLFTPEEFDELRGTFAGLLAEREKLRAEILLLRKQCT